MYLQLTIWLIILFVFAILGDRNIFILLDFIRKTLKISLIVLIFAFVIFIFRNKEISVFIVTLLALNIIQISYWYIVEKKWNREEYRELYLSAWTSRINAGFPIIIIPTGLSGYFLSRVIVAILELVGIKTY